MLLRDKIAGGLVAFGAIGLVIATLPGDRVTKQAGMTNAGVTVAITTGPQLRLLQDGEKRQIVQRSSIPRRDVVCNSVVRLVVADIGLQCKELHSTQNLALARQ